MLQGSMVSRSGLRSCGSPVINRTGSLRRGCPGAAASKTFCRTPARSDRANRRAGRDDQHRHPLSLNSLKPVFFECSDVTLYCLTNVYDCLLLRAALADATGKTRAVRNPVLIFTRTADYLPHFYSCSVLLIHYRRVAVATAIRRRKIGDAPGTLPYFRLGKPDGCTSAVSKTGGRPQFSQFSESNKDAVDYANSMMPALPCSTNGAAASRTLVWCVKRSTCVFCATSARRFSVAALRSSSK